MRYIRRMGTIQMDMAAISCVIPLNATMHEQSRSTKPKDGSGGARGTGLIRLQPREGWVRTPCDHR